MPTAASGYPPLDTPKPVAENVWIVDSVMRTMAVTIPVRMSVVRLRSGALWLHSPTRPTDALLRALGEFGSVRHLVAPNVVHWSFVKDWQRRFPDSVAWAAPGLRARRPVRRSGVRLDHDLSATPPAAWADDIDQTVVRGGFDVNEVAFLHRATKTLMLTDLVESFERDKVAAPLRPLVRLAGAMGPDGMAPAHYRLAVNWRRADAAAAAAQLLAWAPERVIFAHGQWFETDGTARLRRSLRWLL